MSTFDLLNKWSGVIVALANIVMAMGTIVLALGIPWSIRMASQDEKDDFYATLDEAYRDLQRLIIEHPHLAEQSLTGKSAAERVQYEEFAYMMWNFLESVTDYCKGDRFLTETWSVVVRFEATRHAEWILRPENRRRFKPAFLEAVDAMGCMPDTGDMNM